MKTCPKNSVADPGFPTLGGTPKLHEIGRKLDPEGGGVSLTIPPFDPPMSIEKSIDRK